MLKMFTSLAILFCGITLPLVHSQLLATPSTSKLPRPLLYVSSIYDGNDSIFLFTGWSPSDRSFRKEILKYSVASDSLDVLGELPAPVQFGGTGVNPSNGNIYYVGGSNSENPTHKAIYMLDVSTNQVTQVAELPWSWMMLNIKTFQQRNSPDLYILLGEMYTYTLLVFNMEDHSLSTIRELGETLDVYVAGGTLVADRSGLNETILRLFGCVGVEANSCDYIIETSTAEAQYTMTRTGFPWSFMNSQFPTDGTMDYLFNVYDFQEEGKRGVFAYNESSGRIPFMDVEGLPGPALTGTSAVFVDKMNRIYVFGGQTYDKFNGNTEYLDGIWWIDL